MAPGKLTRKQLWLVLLLAAGVTAIALVYSRRPHQPTPDQTQRASPAVQPPAPAAYTDPAICSSCHQEHARSYSLTGMARAFSRVSAAEFKTPARVYHKASDRYYTMVERDGKFYQRRHQIGFGGKEANVLELEAHYVVGSGNHARTFLHRAPDGRLLQLPVSWYAERGGSWAMSPGYDRPAHLDFRRVIDAGCMSCHNGYSRAPVEDDREGPRFAGSLPEGIDCQRCHGPGRAHVEALKAGDVEAGRRAIVNPAALDRERQLETCMQCHLESTSSPLPFQIRRYEHAPFSYAPGKPLSDYFIHFDHAPGSGRDDKFEIASGAYRLRKSACFQRSEMTCSTCHDPHDIQRGPAAVTRFTAICASCHREPHRGGAPRVQGVAAGATCLDCHMPKRRAEDAVHVVMTDHYIQRQRPSRDLLAERTEADSVTHGDYRGEVALYYPPKLPSTPENDLYLAVAQVQQGSNLTAGIRQLQQTIERHRPQRTEFYYELARAHGAAGDHTAAIRWSEEALARDGAFVPALKQLATAAIATGELSRAAQTLEKVIALRKGDANALADLGNVYLQQGRHDLAYTTVQRALAVDPSVPRANNTIALAALRKGVPGEAETLFREAIRQQPDLAEAHNNLGNLLAGRNEYSEAAHHFEKAIAIDPAYVAARHSYGVVLALMRAYPKALVELEAVVRLAPDLAPARLDLADVLAALGRVDEAARELTIAARSNDAAVREAALAGLRALGR
jgi:tetratricopeptide (TPR) repeat protein